VRRIKQADNGPFLALASEATGSFRKSDWSLLKPANQGRAADLSRWESCHASFDMGRVEDLRAEAQKLYAEAANIRNGDDRLVVILRAMELETKADTLERHNAPPPEPAQQHVAQQQQQPQPDDKKE
jgi:hypothetical protein